MAVINNGFKPVFVDIDLKNLAMNEQAILKKLIKKQKVFLLLMPRF